MALFTINILDPTPVNPLIWPPERPAGYDPDLCWDEETGTWTPVLVGGGRYNSRLVVVGSNDVGQGVIFFGSL